MHLVKSVLMAASAATAIAAVPASAQQADQESAFYDESCDRECLLGVLKQFTDALRAGSPSAVPLADNYRFTENNVELPIEKGLWATIDDLSADAMTAADPQSQNAAWFGWATENGDPVLYAARIHVADGKIDQIETVVHRYSEELRAPFGDVEKMVHDPAWNEILPPEERRSRARLRAIADAYFSTVEMNDGEVFAPFAEDCGRLENGFSTTTTSADTGGESNYVDGCEEQFKMGYYRINKRIRERRYPLIDEERGIVVSTAFFDHANEFDRFQLTDGSWMETWLKWPNSITLLEAFLIKDGEISRIEATFTYVPYAMHNPWFGEASRPPETASSPEECNAACLSSLTGQVMQAYVNRGEYKSLPWADKVGYEENSVGMQLNEGIWGSTTAIDQSPLVIADETLGRALWIGRIEEHGAPAWAAVTVSADGDKIGRIESVIRRKEYLGPYAEPVTAPSFAPLSDAQRTSRVDMLAAVDRFYLAIAAENGSAPADLAADCKWAVNGLELSACEVPFSNMLLQGLEQVRDRKVIAVDEARGLVAISAYDDFTAQQQEFTDAQGNTYEDTMPFPRTLQVVELFRIVNGKIARIEGFTSELPYGMGPR